MKWHEISFIRFSSNYSLCNTLNVKLPKSTVQVSLKLLKHSLYCCTFSIFICEKYRIRIPYILLPNAYIKQTNNQKKSKSCGPQSFLLELRGTSLLSDTMLHTSSHTPRIQYIYCLLRLKVTFFFLQTIFDLYIYGSLKKREKECEKVERDKNEG